MYFLSNYYYLVIGLQAICVFHSIKKGNQQKWIWLIVFLPVIGSIAYIFSEMLTKRDISGVQSNIGSIINPGGRIKDLERRLEFANTFENKVALADAYLAAGMTDEAIALYDSCLTGLFSDNEYVIMRLIDAYYVKERFEDIVKIAARILRSVDFAKSHAHVLYALSLERLGQVDMAEKEFQSMNGSFSNFEARFNYGQFLIRSERINEAIDLYNEIVQEGQHMTSGEKRNHRVWFGKAKDELSKLRVNA